MRNFEPFTGRASPIVTQPTLTVQKKGTFGLNKAAFEAMHSPEAVELLFDRAAQVIGLRPVNRASVPHAYPVRQQNHSQSFVVAAVSFCQAHGILTDQARRYNAAMQDGILEVDLRSEATAVTSNRERSRSERVTAAA